MANHNLAVDKTVPTNEELFSLLRNLLLSWSGLSIQRVVRGEYLTSSLSLEIGLMFFEPEAGILVARASKNIEKLLEKASSTVKPRDSQLGFFKEVVVLFWNNVVTKIWDLDTRKIKKALFKNSKPENWPKRKPAARLTILVENELLEIRFWTSLLPGEVENWTKVSNDFGGVQLKNYF